MPKKSTPPVLPYIYASSQIYWTPTARQLPDDNLTVLGHSPLWDCEPVWPCFLESGVWYNADGAKLSSDDPGEDRSPLVWMQFPEPPKL
jgi:hypothetical protein